MGQLEELLDHVIDSDTFIEFVRVLVKERKKAQMIELEHTSQFVMDGALGWKNMEIADFLDAMVNCLAAQSETYRDQPLSWKMVAEIIYFGKIYE